MPEHLQIQQSKKSDTIFQKQSTPIQQIPLSNPMAIIQRAKINPKSLTHADVMQLQRTIGNKAVGRLLSEIGMIPSTAKPAQRQEIPEKEGTCPSCVQRQEIPEEEEPLQGKMIETVQRQEIPEEEEPLQGKMAETVQRQEIPEEEEPLQGRMFDTVQRQEIPEEDEPFQGKMIKPIQRQEIPEEEEPLQGKFESKYEQIICSSCFATPVVQKQEIPVKEPLKTKKENNTGMPDNLKAGVESLSGIDMSDVRVHYNSTKPAEIGALAYTQGTDIHVASEQERHLPHEAWHVVQQAQGRVRPTLQINGVAMNNDAGLEREADVMGEHSRSMKVLVQGQPIALKHPNKTIQQSLQENSPVQPMLIRRADGEIVEKPDDYNPGPGEQIYQPRGPIHTTAVLTGERVSDKKSEPFMWQVVFKGATGVERKRVDTRRIPTYQKLQKFRRKQGADIAERLLKRPLSEIEAQSRELSEVGDEMEVVGGKPCGEPAKHRQKIESWYDQLGSDVTKEGEGFRKMAGTADEQTQSTSTAIFFMGLKEALEKRSKSHDPDLLKRIAAAAAFAKNAAHLMSTQRIQTSSVVAPAELIPSWTKPKVDQQTQSSYLVGQQHPTSKEATEIMEFEDSSSRSSHSFSDRERVDSQIETAEELLKQKGIKETSIILASTMAAGTFALTSMAAPLSAINVPKIGHKGLDEMITKQWGEREALKSQQFVLSKRIGQSHPEPFGKRPFNAPWEPFSEPASPPRASLSETTDQYSQEISRLLANLTYLNTQFPGKFLKQLTEVKSMDFYDISHYDQLQRLQMEVEMEIEEIKSPSVSAMQ